MISNLTRHPVPLVGLRAAHYCACASAKPPTCVFSALTRQRRGRGPSAALFRNGGGLENPRVDCLEICWARSVIVPRLSWLHSPSSKHSFLLCLGNMPRHTHGNSRVQDRDNRPSSAVRGQGTTGTTDTTTFLPPMADSPTLPTKRHPRKKESLPPFFAECFSPRARTGVLSGGREAEHRWFCAKPKR